MFETWFVLRPHLLVKNKSPGHLRILVSRNILQFLCLYSSSSVEICPLYIHVQYNFCEILAGLQHDAVCYRIFTLEYGTECLLCWDNFEQSPLIILNLCSRERTEHLPFMPINSDWSKLRVGCMSRYWNPPPQTWMYFDGSYFLQHFINFFVKKHLLIDTS